MEKLSQDEKNRLIIALTDKYAGQDLAAKLDKLMDFIDNYNALLAKLDIDTGVASTNYSATLKVDKS